MSARVVYGVIWRDVMFCELCIPKDSADDAIESARSMIERGTGKIESVRAVQLNADDSITDLAL